MVVIVFITLESFLGLVVESTAVRGATGVFRSVLLCEIRGLVEAVLGFFDELHSSSKDGNGSKRVVNNIKSCLKALNYKIKFIKM